MTAAEAMLRDGINSLAADYASDGEFFMDGCPTAFHGVCTVNQFVTEPAPGGRDVDAELVIYVTREQFSAADIVPALGKSLRFQGRRWVIDGDGQSDTAAYCLRCSPPQKR